MQFKMSENSLFAVLLRSPWWVSVGIAAGLGVGSYAVFPKDMATLAPFVGLPFLVTGCVAAWRQFRIPSTSRVDATLAAVERMAWREFAMVMEAGLKREGYQVTRSEGAADFSAIKGGRTTLVSCKRWKAASLGIETLRELEAARRAQDAYDSMVVATGRVSDNARRFATDHGMRILQGAEMAQLLPAAVLKAGARA
jgi:restriction system protein